MADRLRGVRQGLKDAGFVEGENVAIVYRWAENQINRLPALAAELVRRQVAVLVATGGPSSALTATSGLVRALMIASTEGLMALLAWMQTVQRNQPRRKPCLHN